jgi:hypothetical protein
MPYVRASEVSEERGRQGIGVSSRHGLAGWSSWLSRSCARWWKAAQLSLRPMWSVWDGRRESLWAQARAARDLADQSHFTALRRLHDTLSAAAGASRVRSPAYQALDALLNRAGRGMTRLTFARPGRGGGLRKVLVTGFDPFNTADAQLSPRPGDWSRIPAPSRFGPLDAANPAVVSGRGPPLVDRDRLDYGSPWSEVAANDRRVAGGRLDDGGRGAQPHDGLP